jgi:hypothetical protein
MNQAMQSKRVGVASTCVALVVAVLGAAGFADLSPTVQVAAIVVVGVLGVSLIVGDTIRPLGEGRAEYVDPNKWER